MNSEVASIARSLGSDPEVFSQKEIIERLENPLDSVWSTIYQAIDESNRSLHTFSCFVKEEVDNSLLSDSDWLKDIESWYPELCGSGENVSYESPNCDGFEFIVAGEYFHSLDELKFVVNHEFILFFKFYMAEDGNYYEVDESGQKDPAIEFLDNEVRIKTKYLLRYMATKQLRYIKFVDSRIHIPSSPCFHLKNLDSFQSQGDYYSYDLNYASSEQKDCLCSILFARSVAFPSPVEKCGVWPFKSGNERFPEFRIKEKPDGSYLCFTCDPSKLRTYGMNPEAPLYLTPVYFSPDVLERYRKRPNFEVTERGVSCGSEWFLPIDNILPERVMVYLGDLGSKLPEDERLHFVSFQISPSGQMISKEVVASDFLGIWIEETEGVIGRFLAARSRLDGVWRERFHSPLFRGLHEDDRDLSKRIRIPSTEGQEEFDTVIQSLQLLLVEYMDSSQFPRADPGKGSLNRFEKFLRSQDVSIDLSPLLDLQRVRSAWTAHAKGEKYEKAKKELFPNGLPAGVKQMMIALTRCLSELADALESEKDR